MLFLRNVEISSPMAQGSPLTAISIVLMLLISAFSFLLAIFYGISSEKSSRSQFHFAYRFGNGAACIIVIVLLFLNDESTD